MVQASGFVREDEPSDRAFKLHYNFIIMLTMCNRFRLITMLVSMTTRDRHGHSCSPVMKKLQNLLNR